MIGFRTLVSHSARILSRQMSRNRRNYTGAGGMGDKKQLRVLVDMDQVLADFEGHFLKLFRERHPNEPFIPLEERNSFYINDQYEQLKPGIRVKTQAIIEGAGFFRTLPPIEGSIEAIKEMSSLENVEVFLCTSPLSTGNHHCTIEKFEWVQEHLGRDWTLRLILTRDKTVVNGHILIDDKPKITGVMRTPTWDHILFTAYHNRHLELGKLRAVDRLDGWSNGRWRDIITSYLNKL